MATQIFINLPVKNLARALDFYQKLGYASDPRFADENAVCIVISETIFVMLLTEPFFKTFTDKELCDAKKATEALLCLSVDSRNDVDALVAKALAAGATAPRPPNDYGFMYGHSFEDLDGHIWEILYMDMEQFLKAK